MSITREQIIEIITIGDTFGAASNIAGIIDSLVQERNALKLEVALMRQAVDRAEVKVEAQEVVEADLRSRIAKVDDLERQIVILKNDVKNEQFRKSWDESNAQWEASVEFDSLSRKARAWDALVAWQRAEKNPNATENEVFPLLLAYEEAADAAGGW